MNNYKILGIATIFAIILLPLEQVSGHGLGFDTVKSIDVDGRDISLTIESPMYLETENRQLTITATDNDARENAKNVTYLIGLFHNDEMIIRNYFFAPDGVATISINPTEEGEIEILGEQDSLLGAYYSANDKPVEISGPIFNEGGLYTFEIEIRTIDEPTNIIENQQQYRADISIVDTTSFEQKDESGNDVTFKIKSYFDQISNFEYDPTTKTITFDMPFDWSTETISHIPVVHEEVHFPKDFAELITPSYVGYVNDVELFKASVTVDDYTEEDERIVHFVLLTDHLKFVKNEMKKSEIEIPETMKFTLKTSSESQFPMTAYTKDEQFRVDLSWEPPEIEPDVETNFIFTIRDGATGDPLRKSDYEFVILQSGVEVHRANGEATVGGGFEKYTFSEEQTGPTIIRFENIRGTGTETEFGMVVVPEFGSIALMILAVSIISVIVLSRKNFQINY